MCRCALRREPGEQRQPQPLVDERRDADALDAVGELGACSAVDALDRVVDAGGGGHEHEALDGVGLLDGGCQRCARPSNSRRRSPAATASPTPPRSRAPKVPAPDAPCPVPGLAVGAGVRAHVIPRSVILGEAVRSTLYRVTSCRRELPACARTMPVAPRPHASRGRWSVREAERRDRLQFACWRLSGRRVGCRGMDTMAVHADVAARSVAVGARRSTCAATLAGHDPGARRRRSRRWGNPLRANGDTLERPLHRRSARLPSGATRVS